MAGPLPPSLIPTTITAQGNANRNFLAVSAGVTPVDIITPIILGIYVEVLAIHVMNSGGGAAPIYTLSIHDGTNDFDFFTGTALGAGANEEAMGGHRTLVIQQGQTLRIREAAAGGNLRVGAHALLIEP